MTPLLLYININICIELPDKIVSPAESPGESRWDSGFVCVDRITKRNPCALDFRWNPSSPSLNSAKGALCDKEPVHCIEEERTYWNGMLFWDRVLFWDGWDRVLFCLRLRFFYFQVLCPENERHVDSLLVGVPPHFSPMASRGSARPTQPL